MSIPTLEPQPAAPPQAETIPLDRYPPVIESYVGRVPDDELGIVALRLAQERHGVYASEYGKSAVSATVRIEPPSEMFE